MNSLTKSLNKNVFYSIRPPRIPHQIPFFHSIKKNTGLILVDCIGLKKSPFHQLNQSSEHFMINAND